ncbi:flavodoxin domain-containing protein [Micrococcus sp.]|uniref:flavodoxin domain-containing protein n=1 Tax=Micrococcus sp. TaxID=1271 RepID=UPI002A91A30D|nr:flavodoxin domain-containing protein [Micrococcus sp.]MDY6054889.1 flavodoxin domain-containing protein [Micrococcus sp.]
MTTLIVTASHHGSTREIAERVAEVLQEQQQIETVVEDVKGAAAWLDSADSVIVAAPVYRTRLAKEASAFLDSRRAELSTRPLVLLVSGGAPSLSPRLHAALQAYGPREIGYVRGAVVEERLSGLEKLQLKLSGNENYGDFRDWAGLESWAKGLTGLRG